VIYGGVSQWLMLKNIPTELTSQVQFIIANKWNVTFYQDMMTP
jgi:hypothetical protein